jgi:hypothetical protein
LEVLLLEHRSTARCQSRRPDIVKFILQHREGIDLELDMRKAVADNRLDLPEIIIKYDKALNIKEVLAEAAYNGNIYNW